MRRRFWGRGLGIVLFAAACDSNNRDDDEPGVGISLENFATRTAAYLCKVAYQCCSTEERGDGVFIGTTEGSCRTNYGALYTLLVPTISESIAKGRSTYDGVRYQSCLGEAEAAGCGAELLALDDCGAIMPLVAVGGACRQKAECIDSACIGAETNKDGVCAARFAQGERCSGADDCADGACPFGVCAVKGGNGQECSSDDDCVSGHCDGTTFVCLDPTTNVCD